MALDRPREIAPDRDALFLDFDGTLVEIAPTPLTRAAHGRSALSPDGARRRLGGALAVVAGRPVEAVDGFLGLGGLTVAGLHGRDRRLADGRRLREPVDAASVDVARTRLTALAGRLPGTLIEDKGTVSLHRLRGLGGGGGRGARDRGRKPGRTASPAGKMVVELVPAGFDKGRPWHG